MTTTVFEHSEFVNPYDAQFEDGKQALIIQFGDRNTVDPCFFMRLQSWDDTKQHHFLKSLLGKHVKITIEIVD